VCLPATSTVVYGHRVVLSALCWKLLVGAPYTLTEWGQHLPVGKVFFVSRVGASRSASADTNITRTSIRGGALGGIRTCCWAAGLESGYRGLRRHETYTAAAGQYGVRGHVRLVNANSGTLRADQIEPPCQKAQRGTIGVVAAETPYNSSPPGLLRALKPVCRKRMVSLP